MPRKYSQEGRIGRLYTPLPDDELVLMELSGTEGINRVSEYRITALGTDKLVDFDDLLGKPMRVVLCAPGGQDRILTLTTIGARYLGNEIDLSHIYEFELRPWTWLMDQRVNARIFNEKTPIEIIATILKEYAGIEGANHEFHIADEPAVLEYCVQYGESDLAFIRRLMEEFGMNFFLRMEERQQVLVITDNADGFATIPGDKTRPYFATASGHGRGQEHMSHWLPQRSVTPGAVRMLDYNFKKPTAQMESVKTDEKSYAASGLESFVFPGRYEDTDKGGKLAQRRLDGLRAGNHGVQARGEMPTLGAGMKFTLTDHPESAENAEYLCRSAMIHLREGSYIGGAGGHAPSFGAQFDLVRSDAPLAPPQVTRKSVIMGPQTGIVMGKGEIDVDEYGRILVHFHWAQGASSIRCRVRQDWAGKSWGTVYTPRVGMEVMVEFLNGDPDQPVVVGCLYNGDNMPVFDMPDKKTISGVKSKSHEGGGHNQFSMDDAGGKELIHLHAQKDLDVKVLNDTTIAIDGNRSETVTKKLTLEVNGDRAQTITSNDTLSVASTLSIDAGQKLVLKVGTSEIEMTPTSITLKAMTVNIEAQMALTTNGGLTAEHKAGTMLSVNSLLVKIN